MRTVISSMSDDELSKVKKIASETKLKDRVDIVEDVFSFMKSGDILTERDLTEELIHEFTDGKFEYYLPMKKKVKGRISFFNRIKNHPYYAKFKEMSPEDGADVMLKMLNAYYRDKENKESNPGSNEKDEAERQFEGIIHYGMELFDLLDDPYFQSMMQYEGVQTNGGQGEGTPEEMVQQVEEIVSRMSRQLAIYDLSKKLEFTIRMSKKGDFNEVQHPDVGLDVDQIRGVGDLTRLLPTQHALEPEVFLKKLLSKELLKKKYMQRQEKRQILYVLADCSGSMDERVIGELNRIDVTKAIIIALMKKIIDNEDTFFFQWFESHAHPMHIIKTQEDAMRFLPQVIYGQRPAGGTNIQDTVLNAAKAIQSKSEKDISRADILLISDGLADLDVARTNEQLGSVDLHTAMITHEKYNKENQYHSKFVQVSKNFLMTDCNKETDAISIANIFSR